MMFDITVEYQLKINQKLSTLIESICMEKRNKFIYSLTVNSQANNFNSYERLMYSAVGPEA